MIVDRTKLAALVPAAAALFAVIAASFLVWWIFIHPGAVRREAAQAKADTAMAQGGANAATAAIGEQVIHDREITTIREITREGENAVHSAAGADVESPAVGAAMRSALCGMRAYQSEPGCAAVPQDP